MLPCIEQASVDYNVPVAAIERVIKAARREKTGIGPMGIPEQWMPILHTYGFRLATVRSNACWGVAAGAWILAVERMYQSKNTLMVTGHFVYPTLLPRIPSNIVQYADEAQAKTGVPASMLLAVAAQESGFNANAVSPAGADGLMQFIPGTWAHYGVGSPFNPRAAMLAGAEYLRHLALEFKSWPLALAGYNAGGQAVRNAGLRIPPFRQTENYVPAVLNHYRQIVNMQK